MPKPLQPTTRFSDRVENYVKFRPGYPDAAFEWLTKKTGLAPSSKVADLGSGTGISAEMLLKAGCEVFAVEPNAEMRAAAETCLGFHNGFHSISGTAEATTLPSDSMDLVTAAQAFHWFDPEKTRSECARILKRGGWVALLWNVRRLDATPFLREYEALLLDFGTDYAVIRHENIDSRKLTGFFGGLPYETFMTPNFQTFDFAALKGRLLSSSYVPNPDHPRYDAMLADLERIFRMHQINGKVVVEYDTQVHAARFC